MSNDVLFFASLLAVGLAGLLYFVVLPHLEGASLDEQRPDRTSWLVKCPHCGTWEERTPVSSDVDEVMQAGGTTFTNWYRCGVCQHRWQEKYKR